jgi:D-alanyl-D-alanine carboxypeptidase (penicillin-binding protein 5/6)
VTRRPFSPAIPATHQSTLSGSRWWSWLVLAIGVGLTQVTVLPVTAISPPPPMKLALAQVAPIPVLQAETPALSPIITAQAALVIDVPSGAWLYSQEPELLLRPASTTKLLTALVARQTLPLDQLITIKEEAFTQGTTMSLNLGETISVENLLAGLLIASGNDAAFALAQAHPQGYAGFVSDMNQVATELGLTASHFNNPSGLDEDNHWTTARDLSVLARAVMADPVLHHLAGLQNLTVTDATGQYSHALEHTHDLVGIEPGVRGLKTGTTPLAGEVLITEWEQSDRTILILVLNSQDRYQDTRNLMSWVMQEYEWVEEPELW